MRFASAWLNQVIPQGRKLLREWGTDIWDGIVERELAACVFKACDIK